MDGRAFALNAVEEGVHPPLGQPLGVLTHRGQPGQGVLAMAMPS